MILARGFFGGRILVFLAFVFMSVKTVYASENKLEASVSLEQQAVDNYLLTEKNKQALLSSSLLPKLSYSRLSDVNIFTAAIQSTLERYSKPELNNESPAASLTYRHTFEKASLATDYMESRESTRSTELGDSGNFVTGLSLRKQKKSTLSLQYQLSEKNLVSFSGASGSATYDNDVYADSETTNLQLSVQRSLSSALSIYAGVSSENNQISFKKGRFSVEPIVVENYLLCPPSQFLIDQACIGSNPFEGTSLNDSVTRNVFTGFTWDAMEHLKLTANMGIARTNTTQRINTSIVDVEFGAPFDQVLSFGGESRRESNVKSNTLDAGLVYTQERWRTQLQVSEKIQPSSTGSLANERRAAFNYRYSLSDIDWVSVNLSYTNVSNLDSKVISQALGDRIFTQASLQYGYLLTKAWAANVIINFNGQEIRTDRSIKANSTQADLSFVYTPNGWYW